MKLYISVAIGGILGALARTSIGPLFHFTGTQFPVGTLMINLLGSFFLSYLVHHQLFQKRCPIFVKTGLTTGFIGSFTTFSTFSVETIQLLEKGQWEGLISYLLLSLIGGLCFVHLGFRMASKHNEQRIQKERVK